LSTKHAVKTFLENTLPLESLKKARRDYHARRPPRPCGLTIHPGLGCPLGCRYCYIDDLGFDFKSAKPYGLTGLEIVYALICNRYFIPGTSGTHLPFGSVTEPFLPILVSKTLEYMSNIGKHLGNPIQFSTKMSISEEIALKLRDIERYTPINPLVTIITPKINKTLEPNAPSIQDRYKTLKILRQKGLIPFVFLRPLLPSLTLEEIEEVLVEAKKHGAVGVVVGSLKISKKIYERLVTANYKFSSKVEKIYDRLRGRKFITIPHPLKNKIIEIAREKGLVAFKSACCANTFNIFMSTGKRIPCYNLCYIDGSFCSNCPVNCVEHIPPVDEKDIEFAFKHSFGISVKKVIVEEKVIKVLVGSKNERNRVLAKRKTLKMLSSLYRHKITLISP